MASTISRPVQKLHTIGTDTPVAYYELVNQRPSGFIEEGTERLAEPNEITAPALVSLLRESYYFRKVKGIPERVNIRHIYGVQEIDKLKQDAAKHEPNPIMDKIIMRKGVIAVAREGSTIGLYDFLLKVSYNESNPDRDPTAPVRIREIKPEARNNRSNDFEFDQAEAVSIVRKLVEKEGDKYVYSEKLNAYASLFGAVGDSPAQIVSILVSKAKTMPKDFLEKVNFFEAKFDAEVRAAEELNVIKYGNNTAEYVRVPEVILTYRGASQSVESKRDKLIAYFQSAEGSFAYQKFLVEVEAARQPKN